MEKVKIRKTNIAVLTDINGFTYKMKIGTFPPRIIIVDKRKNKISVSVPSVSNDITPVGMSSAEIIFYPDGKIKTVKKINYMKYIEY
jgi:hypothetical protein